MAGREGGLLGWSRGDRERPEMEKRDLRPENQMVPYERCLARLGFRVDSKGRPRGRSPVMPREWLN